MRASDTASPVLGLHVPPLNEAHGLSRIATFGMRAQSNFDETDRGVPELSQEEHEGQGAEGLALQDGFNVRPELVVEVAFNELQASSRYRGGLALRFARVVRYRSDKTAADADTIDTVRAIASNTRDQSVA